MKPTAFLREFLCIASSPLLTISHIHAAEVTWVTFTVPTANSDPYLVDLKASIPASASPTGTRLFGRLVAVKQP